MQLRCNIVPHTQLGRALNISQGIPDVPVEIRFHCTQCDVNLKTYSNRTPEEVTQEVKIEIERRIRTGEWEKDIERISGNLDSKETEEK